MANFGLPFDSSPATWGPGSGQSAYGTKPVVPSPINTAGQTIGGNIGNLGALYGLAGPVNQFQAKQAGGQIAANLPGYYDMLGKSSQNIQQMLSGQVPSDVITQLTQQAAERGTSIGLGVGGPNTNAALLRSLGLTSLQMQQQGEQELSGAIQRTPQPGLFNPMSMMVTPEQQQEAAMAQALYTSAPDPSAAAAASLANARAAAAAGRGSVGAPQTGPTGAGVYGGGQGFAGVGGGGAWPAGTGPGYGRDTTATPGYMEGTSPPLAPTPPSSPYYLGGAGGGQFPPGSVPTNWGDVSSAMAQTNPMANLLYGGSPLNMIGMNTPGFLGGAFGGGGPIGGGTPFGLYGGGGGVPTIFDEPPAGIIPYPGGVPGSNPNEVNVPYMSPSQIPPMTGEEGFVPLDPFGMYGEVTD